MQKCHLLAFYPVNVHAKFGQGRTCSTKASWSVHRLWKSHFEKNAFNVLSITRISVELICNYRNFFIFASVHFKFSGNTHIECSSRKNIKNQKSKFVQLYSHTLLNSARDKGVFQRRHRVSIENSNFPPSISIVIYVPSSIIEAQTWIPFSTQLPAQPSTVRHKRASRIPPFSLLALLTIIREHAQL